MIKNCPVTHNGNDIQKQTEAQDVILFCKEGREQQLICI